MPAARHKRRAHRGASRIIQMDNDSRSKDYGRRARREEPWLYVTAERFEALLRMQSAGKIDLTTMRADYSPNETPDSDEEEEQVDED